MLMLKLKATIDHALCRIVQASEDERILWRLEVLDAGHSQLSVSSPYALKPGDVILVPKDAIRYVPRELHDGPHVVVVEQCRAMVEVLDG